MEPDDQQTIEEGPETETIERDDARPLLAQDDIYDVYQLENDDTENNENDAFTVMSLQRSKGAFDLHDRNLDDDSFIDRRADDTQSVSTASEAQAENYNRLVRLDKPGTTQVGARSRLKNAMDYLLKKLAGY